MLLVFGRVCSFFAVPGKPSRKSVLQAETWPPRRVYIDQLEDRVPKPCPVCGGLIRLNSEVRLYTMPEAEIGDTRMVYNNYECNGTATVVACGRSPCPAYCVPADGLYAGMFNNVPQINFYSEPIL